jgi:hypothetical protein
MDGFTEPRVNNSNIPVIFNYKFTSEGNNRGRLL